MAEDQRHRRGDNIALAVIDGTGEADPTKYAADMRHSFCKQLDALSYSQYWRGPATLGSEVRDLANEAFRWLQSVHESYPDKRLMLAGYSRGGSAAILASEQLNSKGVEVDSLFLFDAVARHRFTGGEVIPQNVKFSRHARRTQSPLFVLKYEGSIVDHWALGSISNPTRPSFGNTGVSWRGNGDHGSDVFKGTHGALGGVGWKFVEEDADCQRQVARWMNQHLEARGVRPLLSSFGCAGPDAARPSGKQLVAGYALDMWLLAYQKLEQRNDGRR